MITILTFNIMFNNHDTSIRYDNIINTLIKKSPDVICLQEMTPIWIPHFTSSMDKWGYHPVNNHLVPSNRNYGEIIYIKNTVKLLYSNVIKLHSNMGRSLSLITVEKDQELFNIVTFHLESLDSPNIRQKQLSVLNDIVNNTQGPVICCGDSNLKKGEQGLFLQECPSGISSHGDRFFGTDVKERYDRVWYTHQLRLVHFEHFDGKINDSLWMSDHDCLIASFTLD